MIDPPFDGGGVELPKRDYVLAGWKMSGVTALRGAEELMADKDKRGYDELSAKIDPPSDGGGVDLSTDGQQVAGR